MECARAKKGPKYQQKYQQIVLYLDISGPGTHPVEKLPNHKVKCHKTKFLSIAIKTLANSLNCGKPVLHWLRNVEFLGNAVHLFSRVDPSKSSVPTWKPCSGINRSRQRHSESRKDFTRRNRT